MLSFLLVFSLLLILQFVTAEKKSSGTVIKGDLPFIACDVCRITISVLFETIQNYHFESTKKKLEESKVQETLDSICKPENPLGEWIKRQDIQKHTNSNDNFLYLVEPGGVSKCTSECLTISKSCESLIDDEIERDNLSSLLWKNRSSKEEIIEKVCNKWSKRCKPEGKKVPSSYKRNDFEFVALSEKDAKMEELMKEMKSSGLGGSLYGREDMDEMMSMYGNGGDYSDEEDSSESRGIAESEDEEDPKGKFNDMEF